VKPAQLDIGSGLELQRQYMYLENTRWRLEWDELGWKCTRNRPLRRDEAAMRIQEAYKRRTEQNADYGNQLGGLIPDRRIQEVGMEWVETLVCHDQADPCALELELA